MGLVGRGIGGGMGVGGWVVSVCLCSVAFFGWRVGGRYLLCLLPVWCACSGCLEHDCGDSLVSDV